MGRRLLAAPSAPTSPLLVILRLAVAAAVVDVAETVAVVVVDSVVVDSAVVVVAVTVEAVVASVAVAVAETVAAVVVTVVAVVVLQGIEVALATSRGRRRGSIEDETMMIPRGIMIMGSRMNRATGVGE